eukprot:CAMPEP_0116544696 /NCGR_PEP_ID=MMETSP0397-20121206/2258_1 /TAXON_ID=216820 /ORGANISM="Cyclophora tenuis, Strain ECT3854" /LENGTH=115 /DNA_ID=CAMNT_0004068931 /DNA_START=297 /DNA_END=641 /DNA_ORIENTATION=+
MIPPTSRVKWPIYRAILVIGVLNFVVPQYNAQKCRLCVYGPDTIPDPDKVIADESSAPANTCGFMELTAPFVDEGSEFCLAIRATATRCGCNIPPNACHLCWDESPVTNPQKELQ